MYVYIHTVSLSYFRKQNEMGGYYGMWRDRTLMKMKHSKGLIFN